MNRYNHSHQPHRDQIISHNQQTGNTGSTRLEITEARFTPWALRASTTQHATQIHSRNTQQTANLGKQTAVIFFFFFPVILRFSFSGPLKISPFPCHYYFKSVPNSWLDFCNIGLMLTSRCVQGPAAGGLTGERRRNAGSWLPQSHWLRLCIFTRCPGEPYPHCSPGIHGWTGSPQG